MPGIDLDALCTDDKFQRSILIAGAFLFSFAYVALAVAGWGWKNWHTFFADAARSGVCFGIFVLFVGTFMFGCNVSTGRRDHPENNWIFIPMLIGGLILGWLPPHAERQHLWTIGGSFIRYAGLAMFGAGAILRLWAVKTLGPRHSVWVAVQHEHSLATTGLYRFIRHPSYAGALLSLFGWPLAFGSGVGVLIAIIVFAPILSRISAEEALLVAEYGVEYTAYQRRTFRLIPFVY